MANTIRYIDDRNGNHVFPITHERAVRDSNGVTIDTKLATFITASANNLVNYYLKTETYTKSETDALIAAIKQFTYVVAESLPTASASTMYKIYLIPSEDPQTLNVKDEYITVESSGSYYWEQIGSTAIDLSSYVTTTDLNTTLAGYVTSSAFQTALDGKVGSDTVDSIVEISQADYDALTTKDPGVIYIVTDPSGEPAEPVGIVSVEQTTTSTVDGGTNIVTVTTTDGNTATFQIKNGTKGSQGNSGYSGAAGELEVVNNLTDGGATAALSAQQGVVIGNIIRPKEIVDIPFDGGNYYIKSASDGRGTRTYNAGWISTKYIPVQEGDQFYYTGTPGSVSIGVAGYTYDGTTYTYVKSLIEANANLMRTDEYIYIPSGIDYILASDKKSGSASLTKVVQSTLSQLQEDLGRTGGLTYKSYSLYTAGNYVGSDGAWHSHSNYRYLMVDVVPGDTIELYDVIINATNVALLAKKLTANSFVPLIVPTTTGSRFNFTYSAQEEMTVCISVIHKTEEPNETSPRITLIRYNKMSRLDTAENLLATTRTEIAATDAVRHIQDMQLGIMFENIAVIGDSMARGTLSDSSDPDADQGGTGLSSFGASWLSCLAKRWGCKSKFHYANSGTSCYSWLNNSGYGLGRMLKDTAVYNAYFLAYGHNDSASVGSASDEAAPVTITESGGNYTTSCPSGYSFCAYYKAIINQIRTKAPHAMIFCLSEYDGVMLESKPTYRQAVIDVADSYYNGGDTLVHHLETGAVTGSGGYMELGTHYSTVGYAYIAMRVDQEAIKCVYQYRADSAIKYFGSYNTPKNADSPWA